MEGKTQRLKSVQCHWIHERPDSIINYALLLRVSMAARSLFSATSVTRPNMYRIWVSLTVSLGELKGIMVVDRGSVENTAKPFMVASIAIVVGVFAVIFSPLKVIAITLGLGVLTWCLKSSERMTTIYLISLVLLPPIQISDNLPSFRVDMILLILFFGFTIASRIVKKKQFRFESTYCWFFAFALSILCSTAYSVIGSGVPLTIRDLYEFGKPILYLLVFSYGLNSGETDLKRSYWIMLLCFSLAALIGIAQHHSILGVNDWLAPLYTETQLRGLLVHGRVIGTTGNPNEFAGFLILPSLVSWLGFLELRGKRRLLSIVANGVCVYAIGLTLSRTGVVALAVGFVFASCWLYTRRKGFWRVVRSHIGGMIILIALMVILLNLLPSKFLWRMERGVHLASDSSWQGRMPMWKDALQSWLESPLLGWGPAKTTMPTYADNEWLLLLRRYGLVGTSLFVSLAVGIYRSIGRSLGNGSGGYHLILALGLQATILSYGFFMIPAAVYHSFQLTSVLMFCSGVLLSHRN